MTTIFGTDISSFQDGLDLSRLTEASFIIAKTTEGTYYTDACYDGWRRQAASLGKLFAWYHFLSGEDVHAQVDHCVSNVGDKNLSGMLDVEPTGNYTPTLAQAFNWIDSAHSAGLNLRLAYIPRWLHQQWGSPSLSGLTSRDVHLVSSAYPGGTGTATALYPGDGAAGWQPYGGITPTIYQYTNQASDGGQVLDYNAFRGTVADLTNLLNGGTDVALTPEDIQAVAAAVYNYGREDITIGGQVMHNAPLGQMVHGAWTALNDTAGAVPQMRGQVNDMFHRPSFQPVDVAALATAIAPHLAAGATAEQVAEAVVAHLATTLAKG